MGVLNLDTGIMIVYLLGMLALGVYCSRFIKTFDDFFVAGRRLGFPLAVGTMSALFVGGSAIGVAGMGHDYGIGAIWYYIAYGIGFTALGLTFVVPLRAMNEYTVADIFAHRYGEKVRFVSSIITFFAWIFFFAAFVVATLVVTGITGIVGPDVYIRVWCAKDNRTAKNVLYAVSIMIVFGAIMLALIGMCANVLNPGIEHEMAMPWMIRNLLPSGLAGLILVALMAAAISGAVPELVVCSSILANDVYKRVINKEADDKQLLKVSRRLTFAVGVCGMALAMVLPGFMDLTYHCYRIFDTAIAPITVAAFYSRKVSSKSAMLSMIVGAVTAVFCIIAFPESYLTWGDPVIVATIISILTLVISSQFLKSDDPKRENDFVDYAQEQMALWKEEKKAFKQGKKEQTA